MVYAASELQDIIEEAISLRSPNAYVKTRRPEKILFGLTGSLKLLEKITDDNHRAIAETLILNHFIEDRSPELYSKMERDLLKKIKESSKGKNQHSLLSFTKRLESATRKQRLDELIETYGLQPRTIGDGPTIYLPELEESQTQEVPIMAHDFAIDFEGTNQGLKEYVEIVLQEYQQGIDSLIEDEEYLPDLSERFLRAEVHYSILEYLREAEDAQVPDFSDITYFNEVRSAMSQAPFVEYAIRLQLKENPEYGALLDQEYNKLVLTSIEEVSKRLGKETIASPELIVDNEFATIYEFGNA